LLIEQQEQRAIEDVQNLAEHKGDVQRLVKGSASTMGLPDDLLAQVKTNLNNDRDIDAEITFFIDKYNTAVCRKIADGIRDKFPRELRDVVYRYLVPDQVSLFTDEEYNPEHQIKLYYGFDAYIPSSPRTKDDGFCPEHFWRDDALSADIIHELAESFYREPKFQITSHIPIGSLGGLAVLLHNDRFALGVQPQTLVSKFSRQIYIPYDRSLPHSDRAEAKNAVLELVKELSLLRKKSSIHLTFLLGKVDASMWDEYDEDRTVNRLMELVYPELLRLRRAEYQLTFEFRLLYYKYRNGVILRWKKRLKDEAKATNNHEAAILSSKS
jgi:hypothetical protein